MSQAEKTSTFQKTIEVVEALSPDEQAMVVDIIQKQLPTTLRKQLLQEVAEAEQDYASGNIRRGSVSDLLEEARENVIFPPSDLLSDEPPLETDLHLRQMMLLINCLEWLWRSRTDFFAAGNLTIYYSPRQRKSEHFRGPDFFVVLGTDRKSRKSWVVWEENGKYPNIIVEILSEKTSATDKSLKKQIYQDIFRTPDYFWFDPYNLEFAGFQLLSGKYQPLEPNRQGWLWSQQLELYLGIQDGKLRFFTAEGQLVELPSEAAEAEAQRAARLAAKLRELGVDPDTI